MPPNEPPLYLYSKADCPLCDEGALILERIAKDFHLRMEKVDIEAKPELFERHRFRIPVVEFRGQELGWGRLSAKGIAHRLRKLLAEDGPQTGD